MCEHLDGPHFVSPVFVTKAIEKFVEEIRNSLGEEGLRCIMFLGGGSKRVIVCVSHAEALARAVRELERTDQSGNNPIMVDIIDATELELCARITNG